MTQESKKDEKKAKNLEDHKQIPLPLGFLEPTTADASNYSRSIEMYDALPKYYWGRVKEEDRIEGQFLQSIKRNFVFRGEEYRITVVPARIEDNDGVDRDYFPGKREEMVEEALRKLAVDGKGVYLDEYASVVFTFYELRKELVRMGHAFSLQEVKKALEICSGVTLILETADGKAIMKSSMFENVGMRTEDDWKGTGPKTKCFVRFNFLVNKSVTSKTFRYNNYKKLMSYKNNLSRWLFKRMSHNFIQAHRQNPYNIMLSTIIRDFGMRSYPRLRTNLEEVRKALNELIKGGTLLKCEEEIIKEGRKMVDVKFNLIPDMSFVFEMKKFNAFFRQKISPK